MSKLTAEKFLDRRGVRKFYRGVVETPITESAEDITTTTESVDSSPKGIESSENQQLREMVAQLQQEVAELRSETPSNREGLEGDKPNVSKEATQDLENQNPKRLWGRMKDFWKDRSNREKALSLAAISLTATGVVLTGFVPSLLPGGLASIGLHGTAGAAVKGGFAGLAAITGGGAVQNAYQGFKSLFLKKSKNQPSQQPQQPEAQTVQEGEASPEALATQVVEVIKNRNVKITEGGQNGTEITYSFQNGRFLIQEALLANGIPESDKGNRQLTQKELVQELVNNPQNLEAIIDKIKNNPDSSDRSEDISEVTPERVQKLLNSLPEGSSLEFEGQRYRFVKLASYTLLEIGESEDKIPNSVNIAEQYLIKNPSLVSQLEIKYKIQTTAAESTSVLSDEPDNLSGETKRVDPDSPEALVTRVDAALSQLATLSEPNTVSFKHNETDITVKNDKGSISVNGRNLDEKQLTTFKQVLIKENAVKALEQAIVDLQSETKTTPEAPEPEVTTLEGFLDSLEELAPEASAPEATKPVESTESLETAESEVGESKFGRLDTKAAVKGYVGLQENIDNFSAIKNFTERLYAFHDSVSLFSKNTDEIKSAIQDALGLEGSYSYEDIEKMMINALALSEMSKTPNTLPDFVINSVDKVGIEKPTSLLEKLNQGEVKPEEVKKASAFYSVVGEFREIIKFAEVAKFMQFIENFKTEILVYNDRGLVVERTLNNIVQNKDSEPILSMLKAINQEEGNQTITDLIQQLTTDPDKVKSILEGKDNDQEKTHIYEAISRMAEMAGTKISL